MECVLCTILSCAAGYYSGGCVAGSRQDAACLPCSNGPTVGLFEWTAECDYLCASGFHRVNGTMCMLCSELQCTPGYYPSQCSDSADTECLRCIPPVNGPLNWTNGCEFVCEDGYFLSEFDGCVECSAPACFPGYHSVSCTPSSDTYCVECNQPSGDGYAWAKGDSCLTECVDGYYEYGPGNCVQCTPRACAAGTYEVKCNKTADSLCQECARPHGSFAWTSGCSFACISGWSWWNGSACVECRIPSCLPGTRPTACTASTASVCVPCGGGVVEGVVWRDGCNFTCGNGFYYHSNTCIRCSSLSCAAGFTLQPCGATADARCVDCSLRPTGRFVWTSGCNYTCAAGSYSDGYNNACLDCTTPWCAPGFTPGPCTSTQDSACVSCAAPAINGTFVWTGEGNGCAFECANGFYLHPELGTCMRCLTDGCASGFYRYGCNAYSDATCEPCLDEGDPGGVQWTYKCGFVCNDGYFMNQRAWCSVCSNPQCLSVGWVVTPCVGTQDSKCVQCSVQHGSGVRWVAGDVPCNFTCVSGFFRTGGGCLPCSQLDCVPGTSQSACTATSDSVCMGCGPLEEGAFWVEGCQFQCLSGYFQRNGSCVTCNDGLVCEPGSVLQECSTTTDARCVGCSGDGVGRNWTNGCEFACLPGFFFSDQACHQCSTNLTCAAGYYLSACSYTRDAECVQCDFPGDNGTYAWTGQDCAFECLYSQNTMPCLPLSSELAFVVVNTDLTMDNTADTVCSELDVLLQAVSDSMARANGCNNGCMKFVTNVTMFNGEACFLNICPQCINTTQRRRLLSGVSLSTVSTSIEPVSASIVLQTQATPPSLQSELSVTLAVLAPSLVASGVAVAVTSAPVAPPQVVFLRRNDSKQVVEIFGLSLLCTFVFVICVVLSVRFWYRKVAVIVVQEAPFESDNSMHTDAEFRPQWMPSIQLKKRRSKSRDRVNDV